MDSVNHKEVHAVVRVVCQQPPGSLCQRDVGSFLDSVPSDGPECSRWGRVCAQ